MYVFRWVSILIVGMAVFFGYHNFLLAETEKEPLLYHTTQPEMGNWETENSWEFIVGDYFVGVQHNLRNPKTREWGARFELNGVHNPIAYAWLDVGFNLRV